MSDVLNMPKNWVQVTIADLGKVVSGGTPSTKEHSYWGGNISWISPSDLTGYSSKHIVKGAKSITQEGLKNSSATIMPAGSIHFSSRAPIGYTVISSTDMTTNQGFKSLVPAQGIFNEYIYYYFKSAKQLAESKATGTTFKEISGAAFSKLPVPLPPTNEQHRIVAKIEELFSELDKGIENLKTARAQLKVYRQALLKHAFEGKLTAQWRAENHDKLGTADALLKRIQHERTQRYQQQLADWEAAGKPGSKPKAPKSLPPLTAEELAELPELPEGWGWEKNENYLFEIKDGTHDTPKYVDTGIPFVTQKNIKDGKLSMGNVTYISTEDHEKFFKRSNVQKGDLIISMIGHGRGECCLVDVDTIFSIKNVGLFKFFSGLQSSRFLKFYFQSTGGLNLALSKSKGGAQPFIGLTELRDWPVPVCSTEEQSEIANQLDARLSVCDQLDQTISASLQQAEALRQSILKKAFSGRLVPQDPHDEPASALLARIKAERAIGAKNATIAAKPRNTAGRK